MWARILLSITSGEKAWEWITRWEENDQKSYKKNEAFSRSYMRAHKNASAFILNDVCERKWKQWYLIRIWYQTSTLHRKVSHINFNIRSFNTISIRNCVYTCHRFATHCPVASQVSYAHAPLTYEWSISNSIKIKPKEKCHVTDSISCVQYHIRWPKKLWTTTTTHPHTYNCAQNEWKKCIIYMVAGITMR